MNILNIVSTKSWGGIEQYIYDFCKEEKRRGNKMFVAINSKQVAMIKRYETVAIVIPIEFKKFKTVQNTLYLAKFIKENDIKFINIHTGKLVVLLGVLLKQLLKGDQVKLITFRHNFVANKKDIYHKYFQKMTDVFICVSKSVCKLQQASIKKAYINKIKIIHNGIDLERFPKLDIIKNDAEFVLGFSGRIVENKGVLVLLEAVASLIIKHSNFKLKIIGQADECFKAKLLKIIKEKKIEGSVCLIDYTEDLNSFYRSLDLFVLPSIVKESFGLVLCEAMACGVPVITTNSGAQEEIVENGVNGIVVGPNNQKELENAIEMIYNNKILRNQLIVSGKECVFKKFTIQSCVDGIEAIYQDLK